VTLVTVKGMFYRAPVLIIFSKPGTEA